MNGDIVVAMKLLGAGLAMAGMIGPGIGIGLVVNGAKPQKYPGTAS